MKRAQRLRALEAAEKAEANAEKFAVKVVKAVGRDKKVQARRKGWEDINEGKRKGKVLKGKEKGNAFGALGDDDREERKRGGEWETLGDEVMDGADAEGVNGGQTAETASGDVEGQAVPLANDLDEEL